MLTISDNENIKMYSEKTVSGPLTATNNEYTHNLKEVLRAWLNGEVVQYSRDSDIDSNIGWRDYDEKDFNILSFLHYYNWRIKPESLAYRLAVVKHSLGVQIVAVNDLNSAEKLEECSSIFVKWLGPWTEWTVDEINTISSE